MEHDARIIRETALFLVGGLAEGLVRRTGGKVATRADSRVWVTSVAAWSLVMVLAEYLRYVLACNGTNIGGTLADLLRLTLRIHLFALLLMLLLLLGDEVVE